MLARPECLGLPDDWWWDLNWQCFASVGVVCSISVEHIVDDLAEGSSIIEVALVTKQERSCDEILDGSDDRSSVLGSGDVILHAHQLSGFCAGFFGLWNMQVHLIAIEIGVVRVTHTLI